MDTSINLNKSSNKSVTIKSVSTLDKMIENKLIADINRTLVQ